MRRSPWLVLSRACIDRLCNQHDRRMVLQQQARGCEWWLESNVIGVVWRVGSGVGEDVPAGARRRGRRSNLPWLRSGVDSQVDAVRHAEDISAEVIRKLPPAV